MVSAFLDLKPFPDDVFLNSDPTKSSSYERDDIERKVRSRLREELPSSRSMNSSNSPEPQYENLPNQHRPGTADSANLRAARYLTMEWKYRSRQYKSSTPATGDDLSTASSFDAAPIASNIVQKSSDSMSERPHSASNSKVRINSAKTLEEARNMSSQWRQRRNNLISGGNDSDSMNDSKGSSTSWPNKDVPQQNELERVEEMFGFAFKPGDSSSSLPILDNVLSHEEYEKHSVPYNYPTSESHSLSDTADVFGFAVKPGNSNRSLTIHDTLYEEKGGSDESPVSDRSLSMEEEISSFHEDPSSKSKSLLGHIIKDPLETIYSERELNFVHSASIESTHSTEVNTVKGVSFDHESQNDKNMSLFSVREETGNTDLKEKPEPSFDLSIMSDGSGDLSYINHSKSKSHPEPNSRKVDLDSTIETIGIEYQSTDVDSRAVNVEKQPQPELISAPSKESTKPEKMPVTHEDNTKTEVQPNITKQTKTTTESQFTDVDSSVNTNDMTVEMTDSEDKSDMQQDPKLNVESVSPDIQYSTLRIDSSVHEEKTHVQSSECQPELISTPSKEITKPEKLSVPHEDDTIPKSELQPKFTKESKSDMEMVDAYITFQFGILTSKDQIPPKGLYGYKGKKNASDIKRLKDISTILFNVVNRMSLQLRKIKILNLGDKNTFQLIGSTPFPHRVVHDDKYTPPPNRPNICRSLVSAFYVISIPKKNSENVIKSTNLVVRKALSMSIKNGVFDGIGIV
jgi:hypothetical protein